MLKFKKKSLGLFKKVVNKMGLQIIYIFNIYVWRGFGIK